MPAATEVASWLTLSLLPGLGCTLIHRLVDACGSAVAVLDNRHRLARDIPGVGPQLHTVLSDENQIRLARQRAADEFTLLEQMGGALLCPSSPEFPQLLRNISDPPAVLRCLGDLRLFTLPSVALVGSRAATQYGLRVAAQLATELSHKNIVVVSGAAYGIDGAAQQAVLAAGGKTIAVLGCGLDVAYPKSHAPLLAEIAAHGLLVSEYALGTLPKSFYFPARNRLISGLCEAVVVVEATDKSGSLITARLALDQGREVFAVPGRIDSPKSGGTHRLIRQGAMLVRGGADILEALGWKQQLQSSHEKDTQVRNAVELTEQEQLVLTHMEAYSQDIDSLARRMGLTVVVLHGLLLQLELKGLIRHLPGQQYERVEGT